jgi:hypothetical protein
LSMTLLQRTDKLVWMIPSLLVRQDLHINRKNDSLLLFPRRGFTSNQQDYLNVNPRWGKRRGYTVFY